MNLKQILLGGAFALATLTASADLKAIDTGTDAYDVALTANNVVSVKHLKLGAHAYKIVEVDAKTNGDMSLTTIILVGEGEVGSAAGFESAFQLTPVDGTIALKSAKVKGDKIEIVMSTFEGKSVKKRLQYNSASKTLIEK